MSKRKNKGLAKLLIALLAIIDLALAFFCVGFLIDFSLGGNSGALIGCVFFGVLTIIVFVILMSFSVGNYNHFVKLKNRVDQSLSLIDVYLKMRFDLVPNLVNAVKGYMKHEKEVLKTIVEIRNKGIEAKDTHEKIDLANKIVPEMKKIMFLAEDYPELQSDKLFKSLMDELSLIENKIAASRRFYNSNIKEYNNAVETFPSNLIASAYGFEKKEMFKIEVNEKIVVNVDLNIE